ncbi:sigma 54-interacting transcriptional regulator [Clostridium sp.]|uniref:sigma 54-interacting transcriptional regulator n=1 Tax=Clostridium sp. TaxID=1506 RepID=UPI0025C71C83|nr:sigma 54-interacting transcriptional regulator [Clostridium sp.]
MNIKNIDLVLRFIKEKVTFNNLVNNIKDNKPPGIDAADIQNNLGIVRNNGSVLLNSLFKQKKLVKINSRPVTYILRDTILQFIEERAIKDTYSIDEIRNIISTNVNRDIQLDPFDSLIGKDNSLAVQIGQAKAAIMYPSNGLNTLILGESGVGKTTFAITMYKYAKKSKELSEEEFPFISFNCADYFNNPQLLLSQLFGHIKGAFTGADADKIGLVEKADGGILFLDEVHRLPSDGQEMLFYLMDRGEYHRLGETGKKRKSSVLIIAATTENPDEILLSTFLRRFPVVITLPKYREKDTGEKIEIIERLFCSESANINKPIKIASKVMKALVSFEFRVGNIGQVHSVIKLLCAKAYLEFLKNDGELKVDFNMLDSEIRQYFLKNGSTFDKAYVDVLSSDVTISPESCNPYLLNNSSKDIYEFIDRKINDLKAEGMDEKHIDIYINKEIEHYFNNVINIADLRKLYKIIPETIVNVSSELIDIAEMELKTKFNSRLILGFAFHIDALLKRIKYNQLKSNTFINKLEIKTKYPDEYKTSDKLILVIEDRFKVIVPKNERIFITILLANNKNSTVDIDKVGILIVCHGQSTATSIAEVSNTLFNTNIVRAVNMPLESPIPDTYNKIKTEVLSMNKEKGILLFVDMGSLINLGKKLMDETGVKIETFPNVSTLHILEATRNVLYKGDSIEEIYQSIVNLSNNVPVNDNSLKKKAILTVCATGEGTSMMIKEMISRILDKSYRDQIEVITLSYMDLEKDVDRIKEEYDILAYFGTLDLDISAPYFPINKLLDHDFKSEFLNFIDMNVYNKEINEHEEDAYSISRDLLNKYLKYINPEIAIPIIKEFIEKINLKFANNHKEDLIDLIVHLGCMLNRCVHGDKVKFTNIEVFKKNNSKLFKKVRKATEILENEFEISINDDEVCYILTILSKDKTRDE